MEIALKPCPFCGSTDIRHNSMKDGSAYWVFCANEDCAVSPEAMEDTKEQAVAAWNTRVPESALAAAEAKLERLNSRQVEMTEAVCAEVCRMCEDGIEVKKYPGGWFHEGLSEPSQYGSWPWRCHADAVRIKAEEFAPPQ